MRNASTDDDGTVEMPTSVFRYLFEALQTISANRDTCCSSRVMQGGKHGSSCPVGIARAALREAARLDSLPNSVMDQYEHW
jgi:hypothetical protein